MNKYHFVFMLWLIMALAACAPGEPEAASITSQETPGTPPAATTPMEETRVVVEVTRIVVTTKPNPTPSPPLDPANYPPANAPYYLPDSNFWLVHTPAGHLIAFSPTSPAYRTEISLDACRFTWSESVMRFVDPCSGDEWELDGRLNLEHSTEMWSNNDLDQYVIKIYEGQIFVDLDHLVPGQPVNALPLAMNAQHGITVTATLAEFTPVATTINTLVQVDPLWEMSPTAFPPQQALSYVTFPDSLIDDQRRAMPVAGGEGGFAVYDSRTGGMRQTMLHQWGAVAPDAQTITATLTVDLSNLHREISLPLAWAGRQAGEMWSEDIPLEIGYARVRISQVEWLETLADGRARLRLTINDESPEGIRLYCLHLDKNDPWRRACANFSGRKTVILIAQSGESLTFHLRASLALVEPFHLALDVAYQD